MVVINVIICVVELPSVPVATIGAEPLTSFKGDSDRLLGLPPEIRLAKAGGRLRAVLVELEEAGAATDLTTAAVAAIVSVRHCVLDADSRPEGLERTIRLHDDCAPVRKPIVLLVADLEALGAIILLHRLSDLRGRNRASLHRLKDERREGVLDIDGLELSRHVGGT